MRTKSHAPAARLGVTALAAVYLVCLWLDGVGSDLPRQVLPRAALYFAQVAQLFTQAATASIDSHAEVWLCSAGRWQEIETGAYFPIDRDSKENRELFRILAPLAILGFMSSRLAHADEWIGERGFRPPALVRTGVSRSTCRACRMVFRG